MCSDNSRVKNNLKTKHTCTVKLLSWFIWRLAENVNTLHIMWSKLLVTYNLPAPVLVVVDNNMRLLHIAKGSLCYLSSSYSYVLLLWGTFTPIFWNGLECHSNTRVSVSSISSRLSLKHNEGVHCIFTTIASLMYSLNVIFHTDIQSL